MNLWGGRFEKETAEEVKRFSSSIHIDSKLARVDIQSSMSHALMLGRQKIISLEDAEKIISGLKSIATELDSGEWSFDPRAEDIHGEIERRLFEKIGEAAKRVHTARSRNDQIATDTRLFLLESLKLIQKNILKINQELLNQAKVHTETLMPGMTHFQHAQPISLAQHLLAYFWMLDRDIERLFDSEKRISSMPLGSAALAGTGFQIDRQFTAGELGFLKVSENSLDAVSDRDFVIEFLSTASTGMMHLSRFCEEIIIWSSPEFSFLELGDEVTTGSSIMPQKKNPDVAELIRGRVGRVYGCLMGALTMMKSLPLSYNRDMQEDKFHLFEGIETWASCLSLMHLMIQKISWNKIRMQASLKNDFSNATDLADDLVLKGISFREAHAVVGRLVQNCLSSQMGLEDLSLEQLQMAHPLFNAESLAKTSHLAVMQARESEGGTSAKAVLLQIEKAEKSIRHWQKAVSNQ
jgi:argininosuccinate lyase